MILSSPQQFDWDGGALRHNKPAIQQLFECEKDAGLSRADRHTTRTEILQYIFYGVDSARAVFVDAVLLLLLLLGFVYSKKHRRRKLQKHFHSGAK